MRTAATILALVLAEALFLTGYPANAQPGFSVLEQGSKNSISPERVLRDAQLAWQRVRARYQYYSRTSSWRAIMDDLPDYMDEVTVYMGRIAKRYDDTMMLGIGETHVREKSGAISKSAHGVCFNGQYVFEVEGPSLRGPFKLVALARASSDAVAQKRHYVTTIPEEMFIDEKYVFGIDELLADQSAEILSASAWNGDVSTAIVLSVQCVRKPRNDEQDLRRWHLRPGTFDVVLDPSHDYRVIGYREEVSRPSPDGRFMERFTIESVRRYEQTGDQKLKTVTDTTIKNSDGKVIRLIVREVEYDFSRPKREDFYLTAFGLPELIDFQAKRGSSLWWWLAVAGFTCMVVGFGLWRWYEKHQEKNKTV